jgi:DNA polymerase IV (DinB-like DNA polymerase)
MSLKEPGSRGRRLDLEAGAYSWPLGQVWSRLSASGAEDRWFKSGRPHHQKRLKIKHGSLPPFLARVIGHIDLDYFYAQVEEVENPSIKDRPVVVCVFSGRTEDSGVVSTSNYKARALSVKSGMPIVTAKKRLEGTNPVIIKMVHEKYEAVSDRVMELVSERVDIFEKTGIDEAFFDVTASSGGDYPAAMKIAQGVKDAVLQIEGLTSSVGIGRSKVVAKLGSDSAKPGGLKAVLPDSTEAFLGPLSVTRLYGVGPKTAAVLGEMGVKTVEELSRSDQSLLERRFGRKLASYLLAAASGTDSDPVLANLEPTQFSRVVTLKRDTRDVREALAQLAQGVASIQEKLIGSGKSFRTMSAIGIMTDLSTRTKSKTFDIPIKDPALIKENTLVLLSDLIGSTDMNLRRVGVRVSELSDSMDQRSLSEFLEHDR